VRIRLNPIPGHNRFERDTLEKSELDALALGPFLITKWGGDRTRESY
jgi:hypothetical protein